MNIDNKLEYVKERLPLSKYAIENIEFYIEKPRKLYQKKLVTG